MKRIEVLDVWRSLCVAVMVVYHGIYDMTVFGMADRSVLASAAAHVTEYAAAASFILISGMVSGYSRDLLKRGFTVFCIGLAVIAAMNAVGEPASFGILQFLGISMMLLSRCRDKLKKYIGCPAFPLCCAVLFAVFAALTEAVRVKAKWLYPLGFTYEGFYSADYFPLLPWIFVYLLGAWGGALIEKYRYLPAFNRHYPAMLTFPGRHSLAIYVLHQPIIYGICALISR